MKKPRPFNLNPIYDNADRPVGASVHGAFAAGRKLRQGRGQTLSIPMLLSLLFILVAVLLVIAFSC